MITQVLHHSLLTKFPGLSTLVNYQTTLHKEFPNYTHETWIYKLENSKSPIHSTATHCKNINNFLQLETIGRFHNYQVCYDVKQLGFKIIVNFYCQCPNPNNKEYT